MSALPRSSVGLGRRPGSPARPGDPIHCGAAFGPRPVGADLAGTGGLDREPELLLERAADRPADGVVLPAGGLSDLLDRGALGTLEHLDHLGLLGAGARRGLRARLTARLRLAGGPSGRPGLLALGRPALRALRRAVGLAGGRRGVGRTVGLGRLGGRVSRRQGFVVVRLDADRGHAFAGDDHPFGSAIATEDPDQAAVAQAAITLLRAPPLTLRLSGSGRTER